MKTTKFGFSQYTRPTPQLWRKIGDSFLIATVGIDAMVMSLPISSDAKLWANFTIGVLAISAKFITNLFSEEEDPMSV